MAYFQQYYQRLKTALVGENTVDERIIQLESALENMSQRNQTLQNDLDKERLQKQMLSKETQAAQRREAEAVRECHRLCSQLDDARGQAMKTESKLIELTQQNRQLQLNFGCLRVAYDNLEKMYPGSTVVGCQKALAPVNSSRKTEVAAGSGFSTEHRFPSFKELEASTPARYYAGAKIPPLKDLDACTPARVPPAPRTEAIFPPPPSTPAIFPPLPGSKVRCSTAPRILPGFLIAPQTPPLPPAAVNVHRAAQTRTEFASVLAKFRPPYIPTFLIGEKRDRDDQSDDLCGLEPRRKKAHLFPVN